MAGNFPQALSPVVLPNQHVDHDGREETKAKQLSEGIGAEEFQHALRKCKSRSGWRIKGSGQGHAVLAALGPKIGRENHTVGRGADSEVEDSVTQEMPHRLQSVHMITDNFDDHHHGDGQQHPPDSPHPTPEQKTREDRDVVHR
jgi:hypothetical protein